MTKIQMLMVYFITLVASACTESPPETKLGQSKNTVDSTKPSGAIPEYQLKALDKAKSVESLLLDTQAKQRENMP